MYLSYVLLIMRGYIAWWSWSYRCLEISARRVEYSLTESALFHFRLNHHMTPIEIPFNLIFCLVDRTHSLANLDC
jgi:hypothetical protein